MSPPGRPKGEYRRAQPEGVPVIAAMSEGAQAQGREQLAFARILDWGVGVGLAVLVITFAVAAFGLLPSQVPLDRLPELWSHPAARFLVETGVPSGWGWVALLDHGDMLGHTGIAILSGTSALGLLLLVPMSVADGDRLFAAICVVEVVVLAVAASGWLGAGR